MMWVEEASEDPRRDRTRGRDRDSTTAFDS